MDPIELLARDDRWQLSAGEGVLFAPQYPLWLDAPGFWDPVSIFGTEIAPLFTVTMLDDDGVEVPVRLTNRRWSPAEIAAEYRLGNGATATEVRTVQPGGVLASEWRIEAPRPTRLHLVAWTAQPGDSIVGPVEWSGGSLPFTRAIGDKLRVRCELGCLGGGTSWGRAARRRALPSA